VVAKQKDHFLVPNALYGLGQAHTANKDTGKAKAAFEQLSDTRKWGTMWGAKAKLGLGDTLLATGAFAEARAAYNLALRVLDDLPPNPELHLASLEGNLFDEVARLKVRPTYAAMLANRAQALERLGDRETASKLREEARRHNAVTRGAALALSAIRKKGLDAVPQATLPLFTRPQSTFLGSAAQVEAYVYALARFEAKPAHFPKASAKRRGDAPRAPRTAREMLERCEQALPLPDLMVWLLEQEPDGATDELLYWFSRLSRDARFQRERLERREYLTAEHQVNLSSYALLRSPTGP